MNETIKTVLNTISEDYHNFLIKANAIARESLIDRNIEYKFYKKDADQNVDFENSITSNGKITGITVTSDNDILFDVVDNTTLEKHIMFSCDILSVEE